MMNEYGQKYYLVHLLYFGYLMPFLFRTNHLLIQIDTSIRFQKIKVGDLDPTK